MEFLKGWFADTLPNAKIKQLAILRLDGDMYSSTMDSRRTCMTKSVSADTLSWTTIMIGHRVVRRLPISYL